MVTARTPSATLKLGRNDPCHCGSGKKFKKCCARASAVDGAALQPGYRDDLSSPRSKPRSHAPSSDRLAALIALIRAGRYGESEQLACELLAGDPNAGAIWKLLARALWMQGKDCIPALIRATALLPDDAEAHSSLGNAFRAAGRLTESIASHRRAIDIDPGYPEAHNNLGTAFRDLGRLEEAAASYQRAVELRDDFALAHSNLGNVLTHLGQDHAAMMCYRRAVASAPDSAVNHSNLGDALRALGHLEAAVASYRRALELKEDGAEVHNRLGNALFLLGRLEEAVASCRRALDINPKLAEVHSNLGMVLMLQNRLPEAEASCRRALEIDPNLTGAMVSLAELRANEGLFSDAEQLLQRALSIDPDMPEAWAGLVRWRKVSNGDPAWLTSALRIVAQPLPPRREVHLRYALGKYFDDSGDYDKAFDNYRRANELTRKHNAKYDAQAFADYVDRLIDTYDRRWIDEHSAGAVTSDRPVFIVGMWRSGTTLIEQILSSHPKVHGAGELPFWRTAATQYERRQSEGDAGGCTTTQLALDYLALLQSLSADAVRVIDKMSSNFLVLGLMHAALPNARIIHLQRNPIDTCLSIYFQDFHYAHLYANDLDDLAHYYGQYQRIMQHWRMTLPRDSMLDVSYESLVDDQETWSRALLDFIGLPWDARCIDFHRTRRTVTTNSKWQVRQALSGSSVARWRNYERFVTPLMTLTERIAG